MEAERRQNEQNVIALREKIQMKITLNAKQLAVRLDSTRPV